MAAAPSDPQRIRFRLRGYVAGALLSWAAAASLSLGWNLLDERERTLDLARDVARGALTRDLAYVQWLSALGGVYAPADRVPPNPLLAGQADREARTGDGQPLALIDPAHLMRLVSEANPGARVPTRLVGVRPRSPGNAPEGWERQALERLAGGGEEESAVEGFGPGSELRMLRALHTEPACLGCHAAQGFRLGDLQGALAVRLPLASYLRSEEHHVADAVVAHAGMWLLGTGAILAVARHLRRRLLDRQRAVEDNARLAAQLQHAQRLEALGRLSGGIAHDFNNLLTPILGHAQLALAELPPDSPAREDLQLIEQAAASARDLNRRLLAFGRQERPQAEPLDLAALAEAMGPLLRRLLSPGVEVEVSVAAEHPRARADRAQLELALVNLALNARDAMPDGGTVTIGAGARRLEAPAAETLGIAPGTYAALEVRDTGTGMDEATRARLFEPFFTTKPAGQGTGLGLASVLDTVRALGGAVEVESAPGAGSAFRLLLPATQDPGAPAPAPEAQARGGTEQVLLVVADQGVRRFAASVLQGLGYRVQALASAAEALEADLRAVALLACDAVLPGSTGARLWSRLAPRAPGARLLILSGRPRATPAPGSVLAAPSLSRPFSAAELGRAVRLALDGPRPPVG